ncbi:MAG: FecCD family ABC transporter permease [Armatimonadota bacterium]
MQPAVQVGRRRRNEVVTQQLLVAVLFGVMCLLAVASLGVGRAPLDVGAAMSQWLRGEHTLAVLVLTELRLPRALLAILVGSSLGLAGAALQGLLRNPLAEPGIVGVSACAALGAVIAFYTGWSVAVPLALPFAGIAGALLAVVLLYALAGRNAGTLTLILSGVAINGFAGAATALALNLAPNPYAVTEIVFWMMGSLADRSMAHVFVASPLIALGIALLLASGRALDALTLGEDAAASMGVRLACAIGSCCFRPAESSRKDRPMTF